VGEVAQILDGDESPLLVITKDGKKHSLAEAGFEA
jgi:hypothetical protein